MLYSMFCPKRKNDENLDLTCNKKIRKTLTAEKISDNFVESELADSR